MRWVIDTQINPLRFEEKVAVVRSLLKGFPSPGEGYVQRRPEELASDYYELLVELMKRLTSYVPTYFRVESG